MSPGESADMVVVQASRPGPAEHGRQAARSAGFGSAAGCFHLPGCAPPQRRALTHRGKFGNTL
jgi:hypothetical protein